MFCEHCKQDKIDGLQLKHMFLCQDCHIHSRGIYRELPNFSAVEFFRPEIMDYRFLLVLQRLRTLINLKFIITQSYAVKGHVKDSLHYKAQAVDIHIFNDVSRGTDGSRGRTLLMSSKAIRTIDRHWIGGMGVYPFERRFLIHLDYGPFKGSIGQPRRWMRNYKGIDIPFYRLEELMQL